MLGHHCAETHTKLLLCSVNLSKLFNFFATDLVNTKRTLPLWVVEPLLYRHRRDREKCPH